MSSVADADVDLKSKVTPEQRNISARLLHEKIARGEVALGPPGHSADPGPHEPIEDIRDQRDPSVIGERMSHLTSEMLATSAADLVMQEPNEVPDYDPGESTIALTVRQRREELERRAAEGDKFAISMLTTGQPGDSDE